MLELIYGWTNEKVFNQFIQWLWMVFFCWCITDNNICNFYSENISMKYWIICSLMTDLKLVQQNLPLNTCSKTNLLNYLIITMINWCLNFVFLYEKSHTIVRKSHNNLPLLYTRIKELEQWHTPQPKPLISIRTHFTANQCHSRWVYVITM